MALKTFIVISEKSSQVVRMPVLVSDNTENRCFLDTVFVRMLLPPLRKQVGFCFDQLPSLICNVSSNCNLQLEGISKLLKVYLFYFFQTGDTDLYVAD